VDIAVVFARPHGVQHIAIMIGAVWRIPPGEARAARATRALDKAWIVRAWTPPVFFFWGELASDKTWVKKQRGRTCT